MSFLTLRAAPIYEVSDAMAGKSVFDEVETSKGASSISDVPIVRFEVLTRQDESESSSLVARRNSS